MTWSVDKHGFFANDQDWLTGRSNLVVEQLPHHGWDWVVWVQDWCLHGASDTADEAKVAAERASMLLKGLRRIALIHSDIPLHQQQETLTPVTVDWAKST
jgi:hypothetical protein